MPDKRKKEFRSSKYPNFDPGKYSMQSMRAIQTKYSRDYVVFFQELSKLYQIGPNKKRIIKALNDINNIRILLSDIIQENLISKEDSEKLYDLVEKIEDSKQYFLDRSQEVQAL